MTIQANARSALILAAALVAAAALGFAETSASYAATNSVFPDPPQASTQASSGDATVAPATTDANATPADQQQVDQQAAPVMPSPLAGNAVAENTEPTAAADATANTVAVSNDDNSGWDKASIIGKIFIACGTLLTLGSAARMFMI
jgi:hypothetical protein